MSRSQVRSVVPEKVQEKQTFLGRNEEKHSMLIVCTKDKAIRDWVRNPTSEASAWGTHFLNSNKPTNLDKDTTLQPAGVHY
jgi:hypothetical protein